MGLFHKHKTSSPEPEPEIEEIDEPLPTPAPTVPAPHGARFPTAFNLYLAKGWKHQSFHLGEHQTQPLYVVSWHSRWSGKTSLTLHNGPNVECDVLATAESQSAWRTSSVLTVPGADGETVSEKLEAHKGVKSSCYVFIVDVGGGLPEKFEWRQSHGREVQSLNHHAWGWKLVRLESGGVDGHGGKRRERESGETSDGKEVVAVWADYTKMSMRKAGRFQFLGAGATGELGETWTLMALVSLLRIWQVVRQNADAAASATLATTTTTTATTIL